MHSQTLRIIVSAYIIVLAGLMLVAKGVAKHKKRFEVIFTYDVDFMFYQMAKSIAAAKDQIYDYDNTLEILYHDKKKIFSKPALTYQEVFPRIRENIDYLEKLLQKDIFAANFKQRLAQNYQTLQRVTRISGFIYTILTFLTL